MYSYTYDLIYPRYTFGIKFYAFTMSVGDVYYSSKDIVDVSLVHPIRMLTLILIYILLCTIIRSNIYIIYVSW